MLTSSMKSTSTTPKLPTYPRKKRASSPKPKKKWGKFAKGKKGAEKTKGAKTKKAPSARKQKALKLSKALSAVVDATELSRPETVKKIWDYIKAHGCQDPKNKRMIVPDDKLAKVFGSKQPIDMLKLAGLLNKHFES